MSDLLDILINTLSEFGLPEPDANVAIPSSSGAVPVLIGWPEHKLAVRQGHSPKAVSVEDWIVWECHDDISARVAFGPWATDWKWNRMSYGWISAG